jgi:site-specific recombinase XerD
MDAYGPHSLLAQFERHLRSLNRSDSTIDGYLRTVRLAQTFLATRGWALEDAKRADLEAVLADQFARGLEASTVATRYKGSRSSTNGWRKRTSSRTR